MDQTLFVVVFCSLAFFDPRVGSRCEGDAGLRYVGDGVGDDM